MHCRQVRASHTVVHMHMLHVRKLCNCVEWPKSGCLGLLIQPTNHVFPRRQQLQPGFALAGSELVFANPHLATETLGLVMGTRHCANVKVRPHRQLFRLCPTSPCCSRRPCNGYLNSMPPDNHPHSPSSAFKPLAFNDKWSMCTAAFDWCLTSCRCLTFCWTPCGVTSWHVCRCTASGQPSS